MTTSSYARATYPDEWAALKTQFKCANDRGFDCHNEASKAFPEKLGAEIWEECRKMAQEYNEMKREIPPELRAQYVRFLFEWLVLDYDYTG